LVAGERSDLRHARAADIVARLAELHGICQVEDFPSELQAAAS